MFAWSAFWQQTAVPAFVWGPVSFLLVGATAAGSGALYLYVRDRAELSNHDLDERQRALRDQALVLSYGVLATVVVMLIGTVAVVVLGMEQTLTLDANLVTAAAISVGVLIPVLPVAALAWIEPEAPEDG